MKPDLSSKEGLRAYRLELRTIAVLPRKIGMLLLMLGVGFLMLPAIGVHEVDGWSPVFVGLMMAGVAWLFLGFAIIVRMRYHRHRMRGGAPDRKV